MKPSDLNDFPEPMSDEHKMMAGIPRVPYFPKGIERKLHAATRCVPAPCPFHNPTAHKMIAWPIVIRETLLVERQCPHGIGHPDPDSIAWMDREGPPGAKGSWGVHGCDGCCGE